MAVVERIPIDAVGYLGGRRSTYSRRRSDCARWIAKPHTWSRRTFALVEIAAIIALDAPPASYAWKSPTPR